MAVARLLWRPSLCSAPAFVRFASTGRQYRWQDQGGRAAAPTPKKMPRVIPSPCTVFIRKPGPVLHTTQENIDFLRKYNLEYDIGKANQIPETPALKALLPPKGVKIGWLPQHLIHPFQLKYLNYRGHPLAASFRDRLASRALEQPLWIHAACHAQDSAVVRHTATKRLKRALIMALERRGYINGVGNGRELRGTLCISVFNVAVVNSPADEIGRLLADVLVEEYSQPIKANNGPST